MPIIRPPYCLAHFADAAGCGHHRMLKPMELMAKAGVLAGRCDMTLWPDENLVAMSPEIVVFQRQHEDMQIDAMARYRRLLPDAFIVYELDDILSAVPDWSIHHSFIPYDVDERMARAIAFCDAVSVSTKTLADHIKKVCGDQTDVRVVRNMLGRDDFENAAEVRKGHRPRSGKVRIGWGGGISHKGDLDLLIPAIEAIGDQVEWVFLGMKPEVSFPVEFHMGVPPREYLAKFASLDLDLVVAPLVDCMFNRCKSNLRLLESGACGYPVIASPVTPYVEYNPPVFAYAEPDEWEKKIRQFLARMPGKFGNGLSEWVKKRYVFEDHVDERFKGWLPKGSRVFQPKQRAVSADQVIIVGKNLWRVPEKYRVVKTFDEVGDTNADVLYMRSGTSITEDQINRMRKKLTGTHFASVSPFSNDGGQCSFPRMGSFTAIDKQQADSLDALCVKMFESVAIEIPFPSGPALLLSRKAIDMVGLPVDIPGHEEAAIIEWGIMAGARAFPNISAANVYVSAIIQTVFEKFHDTLRRIHFRWPPLNTPPDPLREARAHLEMAFHKDNYKVPALTTSNSYIEWASFIDELGQRDVDVLNTNKPAHELILPYPNSVDLRLLASGSGSWAIMAHSDTKIVGQAAYLFDEAIWADPDAVLFYADHDCLSDDGERGNHDFKPIRFDYHMFLGRDYVTPIFAVNLKAAAPFIDRALFDEIDAYKLVLQLIDKYGVDKIKHVPWVLAHLKTNAPEHNVAIAHKKIVALNNHLKQTDVNIKATPHPLYPQYAEISYGVPANPPSVSIIVVTGGRVEMLSPCLESLMEFTTYPNYEIMIVTDKTVPEKAQQYIDTLKDKPNVRVLSWPHPYNWSTKNDFAIKHSTADYYLLLNDDTRFSGGEWLTEMVGAALCPNVGAVGARLIYPTGMIQHVGVIANDGLCGHLCKGIPEYHAGYNGLAVLSHEATAVTGACLLISKKLYDEVGGLDERLAHNFNDVAFCIELNRRGYRNVLAARASLQHLEGVTRTNPFTEEGAEYQKTEGALLSKYYGDADPYWNPNMLFTHMHGGMFVSGLNHDILAWPRRPWPWRDENWPCDNIMFIGSEATSWVDEVRDGNCIYFAKLYGYNIKIDKPTLDNLPPFDLRDLPRARAMIMGLGINRIILTTIVGGTIEILPFLKKLGPQIEYQPINAETVCARLDFKSNGSTCGSGWRRGQCGMCIDGHNSPFGEINITGWRESWSKFLSSVDVDPSHLSDEAKAAMQEMYAK